MTIKKLIEQLKILEKQYGDMEIKTTGQGWCDDYGDGETVKYDDIERCIVISDSHYKL